jgi:hypothetical protein
LVAFYRDNGHSNVPDDYEESPELLQWMATQGKQLKNFNNEATLLLANETIRYKIQLLNEIQFDWERHSRRKKCEHEGCPNYAIARGVCETHGGGGRKRKTCEHEGCPNNAVARGFCGSHGGKKT